MTEETLRDLFFEMKEQFIDMKVQLKYMQKTFEEFLQRDYVTRSEVLPLVKEELRRLNYVTADDVPAIVLETIKKSNSDKLINANGWFNLLKNGFSLLGIFCAALFLVKELITLVK